MNWLNQLFTQHSIAQAVIVYGCIIAIGIALGKIRVYGISLGITWVLFVGIIAAHFGVSVDEATEHFLKEFGLILFVYAIGLQVGPGFFASLKKQALSVNILAAGVVLIGVLLTVVFYFLSGNNIGIMTGILSGAVTNTPGLGAAQQAINDLELAKHGIDVSTVGLAYAVAYPFGVIGIIIVLISFKSLFKVSIADEQEKHRRLLLRNPERPLVINLVVENPLLFKQPLKKIASIVTKPFVVSRMRKGDELIAPVNETILEQNDVVLFVASKAVVEQLKVLVGKESAINLQDVEGKLISRHIIVTRKGATHKKLFEMPDLFQTECHITRISRAGIEFIANGDSMLHVGDQITVVGTDDGIRHIEKVVGNSLKRLEAPDLGPIFFGIVLGVIFGSIPFAIPGIPVAVKIGLAGGPLIIALLLSQFGNVVYLNNYTTQSANLMIREIGIVLFLASIGLGSGKHFAEILSGGQGWQWMGIGMLITLIPLFTIGLIAKYVFKKTYFEICGLLAGASTDPPALAFAIQMAGNDTPSVTYATVYPLTMILRILAAQLLILFFA